MLYVFFLPQLINKLKKPTSQLGKFGRTTMSWSAKASVLRLGKKGPQYDQDQMSLSHLTSVQG